MARLALVREQISSIEKTRAERLERAPDTGPHAMVRLLARVIGIEQWRATPGSRDRPTRAVEKPREGAGLARWYRTRTEGPSGARKTTMIVALARKLLIALWRLVTTGKIPCRVVAGSASNIIKRQR
jgi:transposase